MKTIISTAIIAIILLVITFFIIRKLILDKKNGNNSCGAECGCCPHREQCHPSKK